MGMFQCHIIDITRPLTNFLGIFGKFGGVFAAMPSTILGAMQVFLYATIAVSGLRILATIGWTRRDRFILSASLGMGLMDILAPQWFADVLPSQTNNTSLDGFIQGINLIVETPFILTMLVGVLLNAIMPRDRSHLRNTLPQLSQEESGSEVGMEGKRQS
jgi:xanthine/uracil permease